MEEKPTPNMYWHMAQKKKRRTQYTFAVQRLQQTLYHSSTLRLYKNVTEQIAMMTYIPRRTGRYTSVQ